MNDSGREGGARGAAQKGQPGGCVFEGDGVVPQCTLCIDCKLQTNIRLTQMAQLLFRSFFHSGI